MLRSDRLRTAPLLAVSALVVALIGCTAELGGDVKVDGEAFTPTECNSGQLNGFAGVDLIDNGGRTLRIVQSPTNQPQAILMAGNQVADLGPCGTMTLNRQNSTVNDVVNVMGDATLDCEVEGHSVKGSVTFKNCH